MSSFGIKQKAARRWSDWIVHEGGRELRAGQPGDLIEISFVKITPQGLIWHDDQFFLQEIHFGLSWEDLPDWAIVAFRIRKPCERSIDAIRSLREIARDPERFATPRQERVISQDGNPPNGRKSFFKSSNQKGSNR